MIYNRTPHTVVLLGDRLAPLATFPSLGEARAVASRVLVDEIELDPAAPGALPLAFVYQVAFGEVTDLPDPTPGDRHIVSRITAEAARAQGRTTDDLLIPDDVVRGTDGQPLGCRAFSRL